LPVFHTCLSSCLPVMPACHAFRTCFVPACLCLFVCLCTYLYTYIGLINLKTTLTTINTQYR
jgi:hypothetical protein